MKNSKKNKKLNIENLILLIIFAISAGDVLGCIGYVFINIFKSISITPVGCITFSISLIVAVGLYGYLFEDDDK